jgi:tellurite resistance protein
VRPPRRRITPNLFAISFGLAGLAQVWTTAARVTAAPAAIADSLWLFDAAVWITTLGVYARSIRSSRGWRAELADHVFGPFVSVPPIVGLLLAGGLEPHARTAALGLYIGSLVVALGVAGHLLATGALDDAPSTHWHPGYYLPSVGAPLIGAGEAAGFGHPDLARLLFGFGVISWVLIGGILLHHLVGQQRLPTPLIPTMAILIAPPVVAGNAWFAINGGRADGVALGLAGYAVLMAIVQVSLIPAYRTVPFGPGWWSYSFPYAAAVSDAVGWLAVEHAAHRVVWTCLLLGGITVFVGYLSARTLIALLRHSFLPRPNLTVVTTAEPQVQAA